MTQIRVFVAIELSADLKYELRRIQRELKDARGMEWVRWVAPENIHLTLKFLGEVSEETIPDLERVLREAANGHSPLELRVRGLGCFPNVRRPNNIWVGIEGDVSRLVELASRLEEAFAGIGFAREPRAFSAHLTLGRIRRDARPSERMFIGQLIENFPPPDLGVINGDAIHLIKSDLRPGGPVYTTLAKITLSSFPSNSGRHHQ